MLARAGRDRLADAVATARDMARTENREVEIIDILRYVIVFML
jgi:hypothetical protein